MENAEIIQQLFDIDPISAVLLFLLIGLAGFTGTIVFQALNKLTKIVENNTAAFTKSHESYTALDVDVKKIHTRLDRLREDNGVLNEEFLKEVQDIKMLFAQKLDEHNSKSQTSFLQGQQLMSIQYGKFEAIQNTLADIHDNIDKIKEVVDELRFRRKGKNDDNP